MIRLHFGKPIAVAMFGVLVSGIIAAAGCGYTAPTSQSPDAPAASPNEISISGFAFSPATLTVPVGTTVTWTNLDSVGHTVTGDGGLKSNNLSRGDTFSYTFAQAGTFQYTCAYHPGMTGTVIITP